MSIIVDSFKQKLGYLIFVRKGGGSVQFDNLAVGTVIRRHRKEKSMTQELLSGLAGIARSHLSMIENGTKQPNFETIWRIAEALDLPPSELVAEIEAETTHRLNSTT